MNLTLNLLFEKSGIPYNADSFPELNTLLFSGVRFFLSSDSFKRPDILYISDEHKTAQSNTSSCALIFSNTTDLQKDVKRVQIPGLSSAEAVTVFQKIFDEYHEWDSKMKHVLMIRGPLQDLLDIASEKLENPIAIFDSSQTMICYAGTFTGDSSGTIWDGVLENGYAAFGYYTKNELGNIQKSFQNNRSALVIQPQRNQNHRHLSCPIVWNDTLMGSTGAVDINAPFTANEIFLTEYISSLFALAYRSLSGVGTTDDDSYYLLRLISGMDIGDRIIHYHLSRMNWEINDEFYLLCFSSDVIDISLKETQLRKDIARQFPKIILFSYDHMVIAVIRRKDYNLEDTETADLLREICENNYLFCGVSNCFRDFRRIKYYYMQGKTALSFRKDAGSPLVYFSSCITEHVMHSLDAATSLKALCHPKILELYDSDRKNRIELISSLYTYLVMGRNIANAARRLFLHRNTLLYRI